MTDCIFRHTQLIYIYLFIYLSRMNLFNLGCFPFPLLFFILLPQSSSNYSYNDPENRILVRESIYIFRNERRPETVLVDDMYQYHPGVNDNG